MKHLLDRYWTASILLLVLGAILFSPWWACGRVVAPLDVLTELYEPWADDSRSVEVYNHFTCDAVIEFFIYRKHAERLFALDGWVGWDDLTGGGFPQYANTMAINHDWSMQLHRTFDFWDAWHLGLLGHFLIAGFGMLAFLSLQKVSPGVALAAAFAYAANSQFVLWLFHGWHLASFAWAPWILWAMYRYRDGRRGAWPLVPGFLALAFLGGSLQTSVFVVLLMVALGVAWTLESGLNLRSVARTGGLFGLWGLLGLGLAGVALVPTTLTYLDSVRAGTPAHSLGEPWSPWTALTSMAFAPLQALPSLLGSPRSLDVAKLFHRSLFDIAFFGLLPMLIAFRCLLCRAAPLGARCLMFFGLLLPLTPLVDFLYYRVQLLFVLGGVWAFAGYWQHADDAALERIQRRLWRLGGLGLTVWVAASIGLVVFEQPIDALVEAQVEARLSAGQGTFSVFHEWMHRRARRLVSELMIWHPRQLATGVEILLALVLLRRRARGERSTGTLLAATLVGVGGFSLSWVTLSDPGALFPETPDLLKIEELVGDGRVTVVEDPERPRLLPPNTLAAYGISSIKHRGRVLPPTMWQTAGHPTDARGLGPLAVTHAITYRDRDPGEGWECIFRGHRMALWRNRYGVPRYALTSPTVPLSASPADEVEVLAATPCRRRLRIPAGYERLRVSENWSEGWQYRIDGGPRAPVVREDDLSMSVPLDGQPCELELIYRPARRAQGIGLSLASFVALLAMVSCPGRDRRGPYAFPEPRSPCAPCLGVPGGERAELVGREG